MHQFRQYVIMTLVLLGCAACVFFGIRQIVSDPNSTTEGFAVGDWEGIKVPRYTGPAVYHAPSAQGGTVSMPMVSSTSQSLFRHSTGVSYSGAGTATVRTSFEQPSYQPVYQTSNSVVHSIGGGGGSGAGFAGSISQGTSTVSCGNGGGFSTPGVGISTQYERTYAYDSRVYADNNIGTTRGGVAQTPVVADVVASSSSRSAMPGIRRAQPSYDGEEEGDIVEQDGEIWMWDGETWVTPSTKVEDGKVYAWDGSTWVFVDDIQGADAPIGDLPWILFLMLLAGYAVCRRMKTKKIMIKK